MTRPRVMSVLVAPALAVLMAPDLARAQTMVSEPTFENFRLDRTWGEVFIKGDYRDQTDNAGNGGSTHTEDLFLEEGLELNAAGSIYHPNLVDWLASGRFGLNQQTTDNDTDTNNSNGTLLGYSVDARVLKEKPLSLRLFSSYDNDFTSRDFASRLEYEDWRHGVEFRHRGTLQSSLLLQYTDESEFSDARDTTEEATLLRFITGQTIDPDRQWTLTLEYEDIDEVSSFPTGPDQDFPTERNFIALDHRFQYGPDSLPTTLTGHAALEDRSGFFDSESIILNEELRLAHTPSFSTFYAGHYSDLSSEDETSEQDERFVRGEVGFNKSVYSSLEITSTLFAEDRDFIDGSESSVGGDADLRYRKKTPWGTYRSNLFGQRSYEDEESAGGLRRVIDEPIVLTDADFVPLSQTNVVPGSITVTNATQTIVYQENVQYIVRQTGAITEIARVVGAADPIPDGAAVLVDYTAEVAADAEFTSDRLTWTHRFTLEKVPVTFYTSYRIIDESLTDGEDPTGLEDLSSVLFGVEWAKNGLVASLEHETLDTELGLPYTAERARVRYDRFFGPDFQLSLGADAEHVDYRDAEEFGLAADEDFLDSYGGFAQISNRLRRDLLLRTKVQYRDIEGRQNTEDIELSSGLEWQYRDLELRVEGRYRMYEQEDNDGDLAELRFHLKRYF